MNSRTLLVLTILVAVLGAFIFFFEKETLSTDERRDQEKKVLVLEKDDVVGLDVTWDENRVRLERQDPPSKNEDEDEKGDIFAEPEAEWRLVEPLEARADRSAVESLLTTLTTLEKERTLEGASRGETGLDEPRGKVTLTTVEGETVLEIGPELPASSDMLVAVGDAILQVPGSVWNDLTKEPGDWRDKKLFTANRTKIDRLSLEQGGTQMLLAKRGEDFWIESPLADLADEDLVNGLLSDLTGLEAAAFVDDPVAEELGLDPAERVLEVVLTGQEEAFKLELGNVKDAESAEKTFYARHDGQVVEFSTGLGEAFERTPEEWRSRDWTPLQVFRVESASFDGAGGPLEVVRQDSEWKRGDDKIAYSAASDVLYAVADVKAEEVVSRAEAEARGHGLAEPDIEIVLSTEDSSQSLALYPVVEGFAAATREGRDVVLLVASQDVEEVTSKLEALRNAEPEKEEGEEGEDPASG